MILANYSDIPSTTEAAVTLQAMQISPTETLVTFNHRYEAIHRVAFGLAPSEQYNKTIIVEYAKKLPQNTRDKLLRKIVKRDSYIRTIDDVFKQAIEINRENYFVEAAAGRYNNQNYMKIETQINELDDSFQDCDINAMNTRSTNRSGNGSLNGSFNWSSSSNSSQNSSFNSRQITETTAIPITITHTTDKAATETTIETEYTKRTQGTTKETKVIKTGMIITKIETSLTTEDDQTSINTTGTNQRHKSSSNTQIRIYMK